MSKIDLNEYIKELNSFLTEKVIRGDFNLNNNGKKSYVGISKMNGKHDEDDTSSGNTHEGKFEFKEHTKGNSPIAQNNVKDDIKLPETPAKNNVQKKITPTKVENNVDQKQRNLEKQIKSEQKNKQRIQLHKLTNLYKQFNTLQKQYNKFIETCENNNISLEEVINLTNSSEQSEVTPQLSEEEKMGAQMTDDAIRNSMEDEEIVKKKISG
jgi:hypothetical protein